MAEKQLSAVDKKKLSNAKTSAAKKEKEKEPTAGPSEKSKTPRRDAGEGTNGEILSLLQNIKTSLAQQEGRLDGISERMEHYEGAMDYGDYYGEEGELPPDTMESAAADSAQITSPQANGNDNHQDNNSGDKRKATSGENSRFESMAKKFRSVDHTDLDIDDALAKNITDLFRNGIDEDRYSELVKDELNARPANCEGLVVVKTNRLVWDAVSHTARVNDKKLQNVACSVVKAATILAKTVNNLAAIEKDNNKITPVIEDCNKVLALMGHTNRQVNLARRDMLKPELRDEYAHLCMHSLPYTTELFGDDVSKKAKEIEDCNKIGNRMQRGGYSGYGRGAFTGFRARPSFLRSRGRGRGRGTPGFRARPYGHYQYGAATSSQYYSGAVAKNEGKRGSRPNKQ